MSISKSLTTSHYNIYWCTKTGCTSLKTAHLDITGVRVIGDVHQTIGYKTTPLIHSSVSGKYTAVVKRDPLERFLSAFKDKCLNGNVRLVVPEMYEFSNDSDKLDYFITNYHTLMNINGLAEHFLPQTTFYGDDPQFFDDVYEMKNIQTLIDKMYQLHNITPKEIHENKSGIFSITDKQKTRIKELMKEDYENGWF